MQTKLYFDKNDGRNREPLISPVWQKHYVLEQFYAIRFGTVSGGCVEEQ